MTDQPQAPGTPGTSGAWQPVPGGGDYDPDQTMHVSFAAQLPPEPRPGEDPLGAHGPVGPGGFTEPAVPAAGDPATQWSIPVIRDEADGDSGEFSVGVFAPSSWDQAPSPAAPTHGAFPAGMFGQGAAAAQAAQAAQAAAAAAAAQGTRPAEPATDSGAGEHPTLTGQWSMPFTGPEGGEAVPWLPAHAPAADAAWSAVVDDPESADAAAPHPDDPAAAPPHPLDTGPPDHGFPDDASPAPEFAAEAGTAFASGADPGTYDSGARHDARDGYGTGASQSHETGDGYDAGDSAVPGYGGRAPEGGAFGDGYDGVEGYDAGDSAEPGYEEAAPERAVFGTGDGHEAVEGYDAGDSAEPGYEEAAPERGEPDGRPDVPEPPAAQADAPHPADEDGPFPGSGETAFAPDPEPAAPETDAEAQPEPELEPEPEPTRSEHPVASYMLRVNGADRPVTDAWLGESLLYVLRERLGLAGAKDGCEQGECGACSVQVDGRLVASCLVPAATAAGSDVRTVEGLTVDGRPSDVQRALSDCGAVQCGFCVPGMAMTVHDLLEGNHRPTDLHVRQALSGNLCRCSGYRGVLDAVRQVVAARAADEEGDADAADDKARVPHQGGAE